MTATTGTDPLAHALETIEHGAEAAQQDDQEQQAWAWQLYAKCLAEIPLTPDEQQGLADALEVLRIDAVAVADDRQRLARLRKLQTIVDNPPADSVQSLRAKYKQLEEQADQARRQLRTAQALERRRQGLEAEVGALKAGRRALFEALDQVIKV